MEFTIKPQAGRTLWYIPDPLEEDIGPAGEPRGAVCAAVLPSGRLNLTVFTHTGRAVARRDVALRQPEAPEIAGAHACWPPVVVEGERNLFERENTRRINAKLEFAQESGATIFGMRGNADGVAELVAVETRTNTVRAPTPEEVATHTLQEHMDKWQLECARSGQPQRMSEGNVLVFDALLPDPISKAH